MTAVAGSERYDGWRRLAEAVAAELPIGDVDRVWTFPKVRHEAREFGTAIVSRLDGDRRRIYTARFALTIRGADRGAFVATIEEVGSGPLEALDQLLTEVRRRSDDAEPPAPVDVDQWFPPEAFAAAALAAAEHADASADTTSDLSVLSVPSVLADEEGAHGPPQP